MKKAVLLVAAAALICLSGGCGSTEEPAQVTTALAKPSANLANLSWSGNIAALRIIEVSPAVSGKVDSIVAVEGQRVEAGDTLYLLDSADVALQLKQAEASRHAAVVAASNAAAAHNQNTLVQPAQIARDDAEANYQRLKVLYDVGALSEVELSNAASRLETAEAQLNAAQLNQKSSYENTQAQLSGARVAVEIAEKRLSDCMVTAPIDGLVAKINVEIGAFVSPQTPTLTLIDMSGLQVKIQVLETDIEQIEPGMAMEIEVQALGESYSGTVDKIEALGNTKTGMFEVSVLLKESANPPRLGLSAEVRVSGAAVADTVYVPEQSVQSAEGQSWVFTVANGSVSRQEVQVVKKKNAYLEVRGLMPDAEVVVASSTTLTDGQQVRVITWLTEN